MHSYVHPRFVIGCYLTIIISRVYLSRGECRTIPIPLHKNCAPSNVTSVNCTWATRASASVYTLRTEFANSASNKSVSEEPAIYIDDCCGRDWSIVSYQCAVSSSERWTRTTSFRIMSFVQLYQAIFLLCWFKLAKLAQSWRCTLPVYVAGASVLLL